MALGHEAIGRLLTSGEGVSDVRVGDHVVLVFVPSCGSCRAFAAGSPALCHWVAVVNGSGDLLHGEALLKTAGGELINHHLGVSAFADYAVVARESAVVIDDDRSIRMRKSTSLPWIAGRPRWGRPTTTPGWSPRLQFAGPGKKLLGSYLGYWRKGNYRWTCCTPAPGR